jgi:uncharacterized protein
LIYLDSCALVKLVVREAESDALAAWLAGNTDVRRVSSALVRVEVPRAVLQGGDITRLRAQMVIGDLVQMPLTPALLDEAGTLTRSLRSLDAIHLASALRVSDDLRAFVSYDKRLLAAAQEVGLPTAAPGAS